MNNKPWHKEPWPWLLMAGPAAVIVAGIVTVWLAVSSNDGLVTDDYYKQGLAAKQTLGRSEKARAQGIEARLRLGADAISLRLQARDKGFVPPDRLVVTLSHPTRAGMDQTRTLSRAGDAYSARFSLPAAGHWLVLIEDDPGNGTPTWRLMGNVVLPAPGEIVIGGAEGDTQR